MNTVEKLIQEVSNARNKYILQIERFSEEDACLRLSPEIWTVVDITEHLFWAEQGGILGMWKTLYAIREGKIERIFESCHRDMTIEEIIQITWKPKEQVPISAAPRLGGLLSFWKSSLRSLQKVLEDFGQDLRENELRILAHPHPISGPLDFHQRLEFLCFHVNRHRDQVQRLIDDER